MLHFYKLHPQDLSANSVLNICHFQVFCEVYLRRKPSLSPFAKFYYCNKQTEHSGGPELERGGLTVQKREKSIFPAPKLTNKVKDWQRSFFYCTVEDIEYEHPLPGFCERRLEFHDGLNLFPTEKMERKNKPILARIKALLAHGLTARDLIRCWVGWQI